MTSPVWFVGCAIVSPVVIAASVMALWRWLLPADAGQRYAGPMGFAGACVCGYGLLESFTYPPERHWHWIPLLSAFSSIIGGIAAARSLKYIERLLLWSMMSIVAAWLLVPDWESLSPPRHVWMLGLVPGFTLLTATLEPLGSRVPAPSRLLAFSLASSGVAVLTSAFLSLTYGMLAVVPAAAWGGCAVGSLGRKGGPVQGVALPYAIVTGGWAFIGAIDPPQPLWFLLVASAAPLALWSTALGPLAPLRGGIAVVARLGAVAVILAVAAAGLTAIVGLP